MPKITDLPELTTATDDDVLLIDDDPSGDTPTSKHITKANLLQGLALDEDLDAHTGNTSNPHSVTKTQVGLGNSDNTADSAKPVSTATQTALDGKANTSHTQAASTITDFDTEVSNNTDVAANTSDRHSHSNKALLDTYTQTEADIADVISKEHTHANKTVLDNTTASFTTADETKLDGVATGATANDTDANLKNRANHTGTQTVSTISDFATAADARITAQKAQANGLASLDGAGKVPSSQVPAIAVTDVSVVASQAAQLALTAEEGDVAVRSDLNKSYIHNGGTTGTMADWTELATPTDAVLSVNGQTGAVSLTKTDVGLGNADNTSDANKPVSTATQTALDGKVDENGAITGATKTKVTYDAKGLVTAGADATQDDIGDGTTYKQYSATEKTKLAGIATGATANDTDANLKNRADHTGAQAISTVTGLQTALDAKAADADVVHDTGAETIAGVKTFSSSPIVPAPTTDLQAATKKYVDDNAGGGSSTLAGLSDIDLEEGGLENPNQVLVYVHPDGYWMNTSLSSGMIGLGNVQNINNRYEAEVAPTATDDSATQSMSIGSTWFVPTTGKLYIATDVTESAAVWVQIPNTPRTGSEASSATPTIDTDTVDFYHITALATNITSMTTNLSGTPTTGQKLWIAITGTGARTLAWGASFEASTVALPTTTVSTNRLDVGFIWTGSLWRCVAVA